MDDAVCLAFLGRIEAKVEQLLRGPQPSSLSVDQAMRLTGDQSRSAFRRTVNALGVRAYKRGFYRREDLVNAIGRRSKIQARDHQAAKAAEEVTEGRRRKTFPKLQPE